MDLEKHLLEQYPIVYEQDLQRVLNMSNAVMCNSLTYTSYTSLSRPSKYMLCKKNNIGSGPFNNLQESSECTTLCTV